MVEDEELEKIRLKKMKETLNWKSPERKTDSSQEQKRSILNRPIKVTDSTLMEVVSNISLAVVDCWAPWCGPCRVVAPVIEELARDYAGKILFGKLNVDENRRTAMRYQIMSIPTLLVFKNGKLVDRMIGALPREMLEPRIIRYL